MAQLQVRNLAGESVSTIEVSDQVFAAKINPSLMHQAAVRILADKRLGTHKAKSRSEVTGGGAKPWRQKGTGRARQGSRTSPLWKGGGVAFPPTPRSYAVRMPRKMRRSAVRSALTSRVQDEGLVVVSSLEPDEPRTKVMVTALSNLRLSGSVLLVDEQISEPMARAARNIPEVEMKPASTLNIVDILNHKHVVVSVDGIRQIERLLSDGDV
jgi:large subunit ribosomal protein L4